MKTLYLFLLFLCLSLAVSKAQFRFGYSLNSDMSFTISPENISGEELHACDWYLYSGRRDGQYIRITFGDSTKVNTTVCNKLRLDAVYKQGERKLINNNLRFLVQNWDWNNDSVKQVIFEYFTPYKLSSSGDNGFFRHADTLHIGRIEVGLARTTPEIEISASIYNKMLHTIITNPMDYTINLRMTTTAVDASSFMLYCPIDSGWKFVTSGGVELPDGHNWAILEPGKTFECSCSLLKNIESAALVKYSLQYFVPSTFKTGRLVKEIVIPHMIPLTE